LSKNISAKNIECGFHDETVHKTKSSWQLYQLVGKRLCYY